MSEVTKLHNAVLRGVKLLDRTDADWWRQKNGTVFPGSIDVARLNLGESHSCVLGHLGGWSLLVRQLFGEDFETPAEQHGLYLSKSDFMRQKYSVLTESWIAVIMARRSPRRKRPEWLQGRI